HLTPSVPSTSSSSSTSLSAVASPESSPVKRPKLAPFDEDGESNEVDGDDGGDEDARNNGSDDDDDDADSAVEKAGRGSVLTENRVGSFYRSTDEHPFDPS